MVNKQILIDLNSFNSPAFKDEFEINPSLRLGVLKICSKHIQYAFEILLYEPFQALEIMRALNDFNEILGTMPNELLDLSVAVVSKIGAYDIQLAINLLDEIENVSCKIDAAIELLRRTDSQDCINEIAKKIRILDDKKVREFEQELELVDVQNQEEIKKIIHEIYEGEEDYVDKVVSQYFDL